MAQVPDPVASAIVVQMSPDELRELVREEVEKAHDELMEKLGVFVDNLSGILGGLHEGGALDGG